MKTSPIPTKYGNVEFRSRTEARWAIAFDAANIRWEYEPEAFHLGTKAPYTQNVDDIKYLPDFRISYPEEKNFYWAEVKGKTFTEHELFKAWELTKETGDPILLLPRVPSYATYILLDGTKDSFDNYAYAASNKEIIYWRDCLPFEKRTHLYQMTGEIPDYLDDPYRTDTKDYIFKYSFKFGDPFNYPVHHENLLIRNKDVYYRLSDFDPVKKALNYPFFKTCKDSSEESIEQPSIQIAQPTRRCRGQVHV
tara:strand:- start:241 stop:993 length:753 start_codon:yes stop_codon:yes gene_type:complete